MTYNRWRIRNDPNQRKKFIFYSYYVRRKKGPETKLFVITRKQIRNWSRTKGRDMVGSSFMHSVPMHKFFQLRERIDFFPCFFPPFCSFFLYSFIYLFFFFLFFFLLLFYITPPFFSATPLKATQYLTRVKMTYIWSSVFFFFSPLWNVPLWNVNRPSGSRARNGIPD